MNQFIPDEVAEALAEATLPKPQPEPANPSLEQARDDRQRALERFRDATRGVDPLIDQAVLDLEHQSIGLDNVIAQAKRLKAQGAAGLVPSERVASGLAKAQAASERAVADVTQRAAKALEVGRERLLDQLVADPGRTEEAEIAKGDLDLALTGYTDPAEGMQRVFADAARRRDGLEMRLLAGRWGQAKYRARGGTEDGWRGIRRQMLEQIADQVRRESPRGTAAKQWDIVLGRDPDKYLMMALTRLSDQAQQVQA